MTAVSAESELDRLRSLVGPSEKAYAELRADVEEAQRVARTAVVDLGGLRGRIVELETQLARARQEQEFLEHRIDMTAWEGVLYRIQRRWTRSVLPRVKRLGDRAMTISR